MNNDINDNILTTGTYGANSKIISNTKEATIDNDANNISDIKGFISNNYNEENSEYINNNPIVNDSSFVMKNENDFFKENYRKLQDFKKKKVNEVIIKPDSQTPKSNNSFSNFTIDKERGRKEKNNSNFKNSKLKTGGSIKKDTSHSRISKNSSSKNYLNKSQTNSSSNKYLNKSQTNLNFSNTSIPGERLYNQFMEKLPKKREHVRKILEERNEAEMKEVTFTPDIDKKSDRMASTSPARKNAAKVEDRLINYGEKKKEKIIDEMTKKKLVEYEYSYHPSVGERSQIMASIKRKERLNNISNIKDKSINKSCDVTASNLYDDEIDSDEENHSTRKKKNSITDNKNNILQRDDKRIKTPLNKKTMTIDNLDDDSMMKNTEKTLNCNNKSQIKRDKSFVGKKENRPVTPIQLNPENNIHDYLYIESKLMKEKKKKLEDEYRKKLYPFKPRIPESSQKLINRKETKDQFIKRLVNSKKEAEELTVKLKIKEDANKKLFQPTVGRGPKDPKYREVSNELDSYYDKKLFMNQTKVKEEVTNSNLERKKIFMENSMKSILKMKIERYKQIFESLDSDKDGYISSRNIRLSQLDPEMLKVLTPLLEHLQKNNLVMNFKEFCISSDQLFSVKIFPDK